MHAVTIGDEWCNTELHYLVYSTENNKDLNHWIQKDGTLTAAFLFIHFV